MNYSFYIQHLERETDKKERFIDWHEGKGYDKSSFIFHNSPDGADYDSIDQMLNEMEYAYHQLQWVRKSHKGFGSMGCLWGQVEMLDNFIKGYPTSDFIWFTQDDNYLNLDVNQFDAIFNSFLDYNPNFNCWRTAHLGYQAIVDQIDDSQHFKIEGFTFEPGWVSYGDSGILMNRKGAKLILDEVLKQVRFMEGLIEGDVSHFVNEGFYTNCDPPNPQRYILPLLHNAICYLPEEELSERNRLNAKESI